MRAMRQVRIQSAWTYERLPHLAGTTSCLNIAATGSTEFLQELAQDADVGLCCHGRRRAIAALEPKCPDDATGTHNIPGDDQGRKSS